MASLPLYFKTLVQPPITTSSVFKPINRAKLLMLYQSHLLSEAKITDEDLPNQCTSCLVRTS